jgi:ABC-type polysaccharide/polyol phosphate export permease
MSSTAQFKKHAWFGQADWFECSLQMEPPETFNRRPRLIKLTRTRITFAIVIAIAADGLQFLLSPLGWFFGDQIIDVIAMILTNWLIGFHWLLLPTFILELIPLADELPTWTACVIAVIALRKREQRKLPPILPSKPD